MSEIERLRALLAEATPGPWRMWGMQLRVPTCPERCADLDHSALLAGFYTERQGRPRTFDLDLTISAVNALPALLDELERLTRELEEWKPKAIQYQSTLRGIAADRSVATLANVRACARAALARLEGPVCRGCGCTDERACAGGCSWVTVDPAVGGPLCSACAGDVLS